jgi:hypothetical protein
MNRLYLPSTPLNVLVSSALAVQFKDNARQQLWLIDQKSCDHSVYLETLRAWKESPFEEVLCFGQSEFNLSKRAFRRQLFSQLAEGASELNPGWVGVGSDRRIEFQYVMHHCSSNSEPPVGAYLDDGLYSYAGRRSNSFSDYINAWLKKLAYGVWWDEPRQLGTSRWIKEAWLFQPEQTIDVLKQNKSLKLKKLNTELFTEPEVLSLSDALMSGFDVNSQEIAELDGIILVPHPHNVAKMRGYVPRVIEELGQWRETGLKIGIKYHPRFEGSDPLNLMEAGATSVIPSALAFEFVLPKLSSQAFVQGDVGTAIFTTHWLRPDIEIRAVLDESDVFQTRFIPLMKKMGIPLTLRNAKEER